MDGSSSPPIASAAPRPSSYHETQGGLTPSLSSMSSNDSVAISAPSSVTTEDDFAPSLFRGARSQSDVSTLPPGSGSGRQPSPLRVSRPKNRRGSTCEVKDTAL